MTDTEFIFTLLYLLLCFGIIYPPAEFVGAGLTIDQLFSRFLVPESVEFVKHHIKRINLTLLIHSLLPQLYIVFIGLVTDSKPGNDEASELSTLNLMWIGFIVFSALQPILAFWLIYYWTMNDCKKHPIVQCLEKFTNTNFPDWRAVAESINAEIRRNDKVEIETNSITKLIATENWIIKTHPYIVYFANQSDTAMIIDKADTLDINQSSSTYVNMQVKSVRPGVRHFSIRFKSEYFQSLKDRIAGRIEILSSAKFHTSLVDHFVEVFKEQVGKNSKLPYIGNLDACFACMLVQPDVKLIKSCTDADPNGRPLPDDECCVSCPCPPMWCVQCLAKWFASRQQSSEKHSWLEKKATCPMCRSKFCILDVCYLDRTSNS